jgi:hypothetical protein
MFTVIVRTARNFSSWAKEKLGPLQIRNAD